MSRRDYGTNSEEDAGRYARAYAEPEYDHPTRDEAEADEVELRIGLGGRHIAWGRPETDPCEAGTPGCSIDHNRDRGGCHTW